MDEDFEEFPNEGQFTADIDAFAEDTGYEGTFSNRDYLFPMIKHNDHHVYDYFNPYDEDECIVKGEAGPGNSYASSSDTDPFGNSTFEKSQNENNINTDDPDQIRQQRARNNSFKPFDDPTPDSNDGEFRPYDNMEPAVQQDSGKQKSNEASGEFFGYNQADSQESTKSKEKHLDSSSPDKSSYENSLKADLAENGRAIFQKVNKNDLPATIKVDSILSKELDGITLDENYFMLPVPEPGNKYGIKVKMYLFGTKEFREIHITSRDKVNDLIRHMITILKQEQTDPKAYEIRLIDDDEDYYVPFYEIAALEPQEPVGEFESLALVKNKNYKPPAMASVSELNSLGGPTSSSKNTFKVYIKLQFLTTTVDIDMDQYESETPELASSDKSKSKRSQNLSDLLQAINKKFDVVLLEKDHFFSFKSEEEWELDGHNVDNLIYNQANLDHKQLLKNLPSRTLELKYKVYGDSSVTDVGYSEEEKYSCSIKIVGMPDMSAVGRATEMPATAKQTPILYGDESSLSPQKPRRQTERVDMKKEVTDYLYNEITAKRLEEFMIVKINHRGKRQNRVLGIDGYNIYNDKVPNREKGKRFTFIKKIFKGSDAKRASRPLTSIKSFNRDNDITITIIFDDAKKDKRITYE